MAKGRRTRGVDDDLHVDLPAPLERSPVKRVLIEQLAGPPRFNVPAAEVGAVALEKPDLSF